MAQSRTTGRSRRERLFLYNQSLGRTRWLTDAIGVDYFGHVTRVVLPKSARATDTTIEHVGRLTGLRVLFIFGPSANDATVKHLAGLTNLERLELADAPVTDAGIMRLKGLNKLLFLFLDRTRVTDPGKERLKLALPRPLIYHY